MQGVAAKKACSADPAAALQLMRMSLGRWDRPAGETRRMRGLLKFLALTLGMALLGCGRPHEIRVVASDYALLAPDSVSAGVARFSFENRGRVVHEVVLGLLQRGKGASDIVKAAQANVRLRDLPAHYLDGPPFGAQFAWPGAISRARVTVELEAGRDYALFCTLRDSPTAPRRAGDGNATRASGQVRPRCAQRPDQRMQPTSASELGPVGCRPRFDLEAKVGATRAPEEQ